MTPIPFYRHDLGQPELDALAKVLAGPILTTGATVAEFESRFAALLGRRHALAVTSCTGALHMSLMALGIGPGDEVITTPMTFVATATAIMESGATPVFVDVEPDTGNLDAALVGAAVTPRTKAILPVHLYGLMCDMRALREIADAHGLAIIEDAAHCIEGVRDGARPGELGDTACFSFFATKNMTCGEGGALVTDDDALYEKLKLIRLHGMTKTAFDRHQEGYSHWDVPVLGWKYNLSNIDAALLLPQFDRIAGNLERRHALAEKYIDRLGNLPGVRVPQSRPDTVHARHLFTIWIDGMKRDDALAALRAAGVECVVNYRAIHLMTLLRERFGFKPGDFPVAEAIGEKTISLPFYPRMPDSHIDEVGSRLTQILLSR
ncbi:DegT/DnrJ/EryC1/StrS family aminotransferase [Dongia sedimenti]|uniref:DegT/DnrJ/EryC1/StrS family aminotransferase n=1 Tax=Dongia sedimenti TaxID=3064282 RepID=A0ABU0YKX5_9PROT|nr:DegT/DnrJ/EryC1/StrS family aminotransferase [Rhodospirillaceae bacterium R-7]